MLKVISRSAFDLNTVLRTVVASAVSLCRADRASLYRYRDGACHFEIGHNNLPEYEALERSTPISAGPETLVGRTMQERRTVQIIDALDDPDYRPKDEARIGDVRTMLGVPLLRDGVLLGVFGLARSAAERFTDRQIELVTTFADQAVIAIENARLLVETAGPHRRTGAAPDRASRDIREYGRRRGHVRRGAAPGGVEPQVPGDIRRA